MSYNTTTKKRTIMCPSCGARIRIPMFWILGIEGIFRCKECRFAFRTGYKMGAVLSAVSLSLSILTAQLLLYIFSIKLIPIAILIIIPLWIIYSYRLRKLYMIRKSKKAAKKLSKQALANGENFDQPSELCRNNDILDSPMESDPLI